MVGLTPFFRYGNFFYEQWINSTGSCLPSLKCVRNNLWVAVIDPLFVKKVSITKERCEPNHFILANKAQFKKLHYFKNQPLWRHKCIVDCFLDTAQNGMLYAFQKCKHQLFSSTRLISIKFSNVSGLFGGPCIIRLIWTTMFQFCHKTLKTCR